MASMTYAEMINAANFSRPFHAANHGVRGIRVEVASPMANVAHLSWEDDMSFHTQVMHFEKTEAYKGDFSRAHVEEHGNFVRYIVTYADVVVFLVMNDGTVVFNSEDAMRDAKGRRIRDRFYEGYNGSPRFYGDRPVLRKVQWSDFRTPIAV